MAKNNPFALKFNGNGYILVNGLFNILNNSSFSIGFYFRQTSTGNHVLLESNLGNDGFHFQISTGGQLMLGRTINSRIYSTELVSDGVYRYVVGTYDRITQKLKMFINGEYINQITVSMPIMTNLLIGSRSGSSGLIGNIDDVTVWNKALTLEEIKYYMHKKLKVDKEGLVGYWPLDEGQGNIAHDLSPYQNHGTIYNAQWVKGEVDLELYYSLIKSNNKYYTYQNNEFIEVEPTVENFKENFVDLSQLTTPNENGIKPYKLLDEPSIVTYTEDEEIPILSQTVLAKSKVRFLVSKDSTNYEVYRDSEWVTVDESNILEEGMGIVELGSIPQEAWASWMGREAYKNSFSILVGLKSEEPNKPLLKSLTVNYAPNEAPVVIDAQISPDTIHNEYVTVRANVKDYEMDKIYFRVLIRKAGSDEFIQVSPTDGWFERGAGDTLITQLFDYTYFNIGENSIKLVVKDERGSEAEWVGNVILTNTNPTITIIYDDLSMEATIGDADGDNVSYKISINGETWIDYTKFLPSPYTLNLQWDTRKLVFGQMNIIKLEVMDILGGQASEEFQILGTYRGLMFKKENGEYFIDDRGNFLTDILFDGTLIGGQTSETKKVILENRNGVPIADIKIYPENPNFAKGAVVEISETEMPFTPTDVINILEIMPNLGTKDFYVRVKTDRTAHQGGNFYIVAISNPVI